MPTHPSARPATLRALVADNLLPLVAVGVTAVALSIGWAMFADRLYSRTRTAQGRADDISQIWGGPLQQPHPQVRWRRSDAATVELASGELSRSDVKVDLDIQYRRRGVSEYPCFEAAFEGTYDFQNPSEVSSFAAFTVGLPVQRDALMLRDVRLLIDGKEDAANTEYSAERISWSGSVSGSATARFQLVYRARGNDRFGYSFPDDALSAGKPLTAFRLAMNVTGARGELDYPVGSMSPTSLDKVGESWAMVWEVERLLSVFDLGVELPDASGVELALAKLTSNAPFFYLLYAFALLYVLSEVERRARALHLLALSAAYFIYFPLAAYLTGYLPWAGATLIALLAIGALAVGHAVQFVGLRAGLRAAASGLLFLAVPAVAYLVPQHAGLILVSAGFVAIAAGMRALGLASRRLHAVEPQVAQPAMAPVVEVGP